MSWVQQGAGSPPLSYSSSIGKETYHCITSAACSQLTSLADPGVTYQLPTIWKPVQPWNPSNLGEAVRSTTVAPDEEKRRRREKSKKSSEKDRLSWMRPVYNRNNLRCHSRTSRSRLPPAPQVQCLLYSSGRTILQEDIVPPGIRDLPHTFRICGFQSSTAFATDNRRTTGKPTFEA